DHLVGRLKLGPFADRGDGQLVVLARSRPDGPYDRLFVDLDCDGSVVDDKPIVAKQSQNNGQLYSLFDVLGLRVDHAAPDEPAQWETYPVTFWTHATRFNDRPQRVTYWRSGFLVGSAMLGERNLTLWVCDGDNDGVFQGRVDWSVRTAES